MEFAFGLRNAILIGLLMWAAFFWVIR